MTTINIDGIEYVKKQNIAENYVIVRADRASTFAGKMVERNGREVTLKNARRLWYWSGAASLSQLAMEGVSDPENCKFPCEVEEVIILDGIEIIPVTAVARRSIAGVPVWEK